MNAQSSLRFAAVVFRMAILALLMTACSPSATMPAETGLPYSIRFDANIDAFSPAVAEDSQMQIVRESDQRAFVTGWLRDAQGKVIDSRPFTLTLAASGGPANTSDRSRFPELAGLGQSRFASNSDPKTESTIPQSSDSERGGSNSNPETHLALRLLGYTGPADRAEDGLGSTYYRDASTRLRVALDLGPMHEIDEIVYSLTGIDASIDEDCDGSDGSCDGDVVDRVEILPAEALNNIETSNPDLLHLVGNRITAKPPASAHAESQIETSAAQTGTVHIRQSKRPQGSRALFEVSDPGRLPSSEASEVHAFDALEQAINLIGVIRLSTRLSPTSVPPTADPNAMILEGRVFGDENGNQIFDASESLLENLEIRLYDGVEIGSRPILTTTTEIDGDRKASFEIDASAGTPYRLEALIPIPPVEGGAMISPLRMIQFVTPTLKSQPPVDFPASVHPLEVDTPVGKNLLLPDLIPLSKYPISPDMPESVRQDVESAYPGMEQWYIDEEKQPGHRLLRFGTLALNAGLGPMHVLGGEDRGVDRPIFQRIYTPSGAFYDHPANTFVFSDDHDHVHVDAFEAYRLIDPSSEAIVASSEKVSFCLTDVLWALRPEITRSGPIGLIPKGWECGEDEQGINPGYSDYYGPALDQQWIDITGVPNGPYWLEVEVDPGQQLIESDESNNLVRIKIDLK